MFSARETENKILKTTPHTIKRERKREKKENYAIESVRRSEKIESFLARSSMALERRVTPLTQFDHYNARRFEYLLSVQKERGSREE